MLHMMIPWVTFLQLEVCTFWPPSPTSHHPTAHLLQPPICALDWGPWCFASYFIYLFFKMPHVSELTLFLCTCRTSAGLSRSWICYSLNIPCGVLGCCVRMIIQWMVNSLRWECDLLPPPVMGQILPALVCGSGALPLHISKVCGHSVMTLFPTVLIMDITFDKRFIN